jgi:hypothetical protein
VVDHRGAQNLGLNEPVQGPVVSSWESHR